MKLTRRIVQKGNIIHFLLLGIALSLIACASDGQNSSSSGATPTPLPTPVVPEKPTYLVEQGQVVKTLEFIGRVSPVLEQELFFKTDGFVADVYFSRGDQVQTGDLLAELEIGDLQNQLAQQQLALQTAEITIRIIGIHAHLGGQPLRIQRPAFAAGV